jgi:hypothetical protein
MNNLAAEDYSASLKRCFVGYDWMRKAPRTVTTVACEENYRVL